MMGERSVSVAGRVPFSKLCQVLDGIAGAKKPDRRKAWLREFITKWRSTHHEIHGNNKTDIGDFAAKASRVLTLRLAQSCKMTIEDLNSHLDNIALANAAKEKGKVERELELLCRKVTAVEMKWLIRMLLKQMKLGMQETTVLGVFHPEAGQLYDVTTSLQKVAQQLRDPATKLDTIQIELFSPFRPMLANRAPPGKVPEIMGNQAFFVEIKYDGERVQLHKHANKYKYYSRNGNEFTSSYGGGPTEGSLTPNIHDVFSPRVESCILDGEMVGWNPEAKCIATKGEQFDVKSLKVGDELHPALVVFDCLMLNGEVMSQKPLRERIDTLHTLFPAPLEGRCMLAHHKELSTKEDVVESLNHAIEMREEGLVIKRPDSTYRLNTRSNEGGWLKIKPDYVDAICDDLDLVIVGGYFGEGRRSNLMSHFLLALAQPPEEPGGEPSGFATVCKVGSGYSMKELYDLNIHLNQFAKLTRVTDKKSKVPDWLTVGQEKPEVRAAEIIVSNAYAVGYTLRFPRAEKIRTDKEWKDAMTTKEFHQLRVESEGKLAQKVKADEEGPSPAKKRKKAGPRVAVKPAVGGNFRTADLRGVARLGDTFAGKELVVVNGTRGRDKKDLQKGLASLGGLLAENPGPKTLCCVAGTRDVRVGNLIQRGSVDVVKAHWLVQCLQQKQFIQWTPEDMWFATQATEKGFARDFDEYGDSYYHPITPQQLKSCLQNVKTCPETSKTTRDDLAEFEMEHFSDNKYGMFRRCKFYVDRYLIVERLDAPIRSSPLHLLEAVLKVHGGRTVPLCSLATHILTHPSDLSRVQEFEMMNRSREKKIHIVTAQWAKDSIQCQKLLEERNYQASSF